MSKLLLHAQQLRHRLYRANPTGNQCACAILARMQSSTSPRAASGTDAAAADAPALAGELLALWRAVIASTGVGAYAIFEELDLTLTQVKALVALSDSELTVKELAERLGLSLPGASRAVDVLVERELIGRRECTTDRRQKRLRCTVTGIRALERLDEARLAGIEQFTATLPPAQARRLSAALRPILDDLEAAKERA